MTIRPPTWSTTEQAGILCQRSWWKTASDQQAGQPMNKDIRPNTRVTDSSGCQLKSVITAIWMPMLWSNVHPNYTKLGKVKHHLASWPFVAHPKAHAIKQVETTKSNGFANSMAYRGAKTVQQLWTPMPPRWPMSPALTTSLTSSSLGPHLHQFFPTLLQPMTTRLTLLQIHLHPCRIRRRMSQHVPIPVTRVIRHHHTEILVQTNIIDLLLAAVQHGTIIHGGMTPPTTTVAILHSKKGVLVVDTVKGVPELIAITRPPHDPDGDVYDIVGVYWYRGLPAFWSTMLLPTLGSWAISSKKPLCITWPLFLISSRFFRQVWLGLSHTPSHTQQGMWILYGWG